MASSKSWFRQASSSRSHLLSDSNHELPRWRSQSPSASMMIPPPIVQSTYLPTAAKTPLAEPIFAEKPTEVEDRQQQLEADLQFLLDAQAEGLIRGLDGGSLDERSSTGSTTPTVQSIRGSSARRTRKPARKQPGLKSARKGIYNGIIALASLKDEELLDMNGQIRENEQTLQQIDKWEEKRKGLREATTKLDSGEDIVRVQRLQQEANTLQDEINRVEIHLAELKSKHRKLLKQASLVENSVQAKIASYTSSLRQMEEDVHKFLSFKPQGANSRPSSPDGKTSIWQLPPKRRNLELAKEYWEQQRALGQTQKTDIVFEQSALKEGADLWREAVAEITDFEKLLRTQMSALPSSPGSQSAWEEPPSTGAAEHLKELLSTMSKVLTSLQTKLEKAEENGWTLLIAALAAELDALRRGNDILTNALAKFTDEDNVAEKSGNEDLGNAESPGQEIRELDSSFTRTRIVGQVPDADDDEPPPELLFSQGQYNDTE